MISLRFQTCSNPEKKREKHKHLGGSLINLLLPHGMAQDLVYLRSGSWIQICYSRYHLIGVRPEIHTPRGEPHERCSIRDFLARSCSYLQSATPVLVGNLIEESLGHWPKHREMPSQDFLFRPDVALHKLFVILYEQKRPPPRANMHYKINGIIRGFVALAVHSTIKKTYREPE
jgi:hypothetical protein